MAASTVDQLKALWSRLNADPNATKARKAEPDWLVLQWEPHGVTIVEAHVGDRITLKHVADLAWGGASNPDDSTVSAGSLLKERLAALKISTRQTAVIVGRDAVVLRRIELPYVADNELPDMVRFQAAAKASTPIDRLALDFIPLETLPEAPRVAVTVTMDGSRMKTINETIAGAGLELVSVGLSATALTALVTEAGAPKGVTLVLLQKGENLELSLLEGGRLTFSHSIRLEETEGAPVLQPLQAELNRALVAMSQAHTAAAVARVFVIPGVQLNPAVNEILEKRFPGLVQRLDPRDRAQITSLTTEEQTVALKAGPAIGHLAAVQQANVQLIDFVNPRKRVLPPDTRKAKIRAIGGGAALLALLGYWMNSNAIADRQAQLDALKSEAATTNQEVTSKQGKEKLEAALKLKRWKESDPHPLAAIEKLSSLLPPTGEAILTDVIIRPGKPASQGDATIAANVKVLTWAKSDDVVTGLENRLAGGGYSFSTPILPESHGRDPDYPLLYTLVADQLVPKPAPPRPTPPKTN